MDKKEQSERLKEMRRLYEIEKWSLREIADHFSLTKQAIHNRLVRAGVSLRQKGVVKRFLDRETLVKLYIDEKLTIGDTAKRLKMSCARVSKEIERHGIEKRSSGYFQRKYQELHQLKVGESAIIKRPSVTKPHRNLYEKARKLVSEFQSKELMPKPYKS
jgi:predicted DNA-binding protein YlxM (UPF0122 family)